MSARLAIAVSACLTGRRVRYDGASERCSFVTEVLPLHLDLIPVCPEVELGMTIPREKIRLRGGGETPSLIGEDSGTDWTEAMLLYARERITSAGLATISGYILKSRSPSCGMGDVKLFDESGAWRREGTGLFARTLLDLCPDLPVINEIDLDDAPLRGSFFARAFAYHCSRFAPETDDLAHLARAERAILQAN